MIVGRPRGAKPLAVLLFLSSLAGCGHVPVTSMVKLARIDFQTTDPARLRVALRLPRALKARAETTVLRVTVRLADGAEESRDFALREVNEVAELAAEAEEGSAIATFAIAERDIVDVRMFRGALVQKQKGASRGGIRITVRPDACRIAPLPAGPVVFSTYLKSAETGSYVPLARDLDLRTLDPNRDLVAMIPPCG